MMDTCLRVLEQPWLEEHILLDKNLLSAIRQAFIILAEEAPIIPPVQQISIMPVKGQVCIKSAYAPSLPYFVVKMAGIFPKNIELGERGNQGCMCLFNAVTGRLDTILADNGLLTQLRTAASGAIAADHLAPNIVDKVAIIGAGTQAKLQLQALTLVREFTSVAIYNRTTQKAEELATWVAQELHKEVCVAPTVSEAVNNAQVIVTNTSATEHLIESAHMDLNRPVHITAIGSDAPHKNELSPDLYASASRYVCDLKSQSFRLGELRAVVDSGQTQFDKVEEIADICRHQKYRDEHDVLTICDLTGVGLLDLAIALYARDKYCG